MSGRLIISPYNIELEVGQSVQRMAEVVTGFNIAPFRQLTILRQQTSQLTLDQAFWGFTPSWMKQLDQAPYIIRSEKLSTSPMFQESWQQRRCLLPVTGYYIWVQMKRRKQAFAIRREHNRPFFLAGIWTRYPVTSQRYYDSFGLISTPAETWLGQLTSRTPLALPHSAALTWLETSSCETQLQELLAPDAVHLDCYPVSDLVNDPANQSAQVASPIADRQRRPS